MIAKEALALVKRKHPEANAQECYLYDGKYYVFVCPESNKPMTGSVMYYAVATNGGPILGFSPTADIKKWAEAVAYHEIEL